MTFSNIGTAKKIYRYLSVRCIFLGLTELMSGVVGRFRRYYFIFLPISHKYHILNSLENETPRQIPQCKMHCDIWRGVSFSSKFRKHISEDRFLILSFGSRICTLRFKKKQKSVQIGTLTQKSVFSEPISVYRYGDQKSVQIPINRYIWHLWCV